MSKSKDILDLNLLKRVILFAKPYKSRFIFAAIFAITLSFLGPIRPYLISHAVDNYILVPKPELLLNMMIILFVLLILEGCMQFFYMYLSTWIGQNVIKDIREVIFKHILNLKKRYFDNTPIGTLVTRSISDIETISDIFSQGLLVIIAEFLRLIIVVLVMFYTDWRLTLITLLTIPFLLIATAWFKKNIKISFENVRDEVARLNTFVQEHIVGMKIVQIFNREDAEYNKFYEINKSHQNAHIKSIFYYAVFFPIVEILSASAIALIVWYGGTLISYGENVTIGELTAFILLIHMMFRPIRQLADRFNILQMGIVGSQRVFNVIDNVSELEFNSGDQKILKSPKISFNNVHFEYKKNELVLKGLSFDIDRGETLAVVGRTGAGKTSMINIINRFYEIKSGVVKINDKNIYDIDLNNLRENISLINQDVFLFSESIINNVGLYDPNISKQMIIDGAKEIGLHEFINSLPSAYEYVIGERGVNLSVGQRQLIAFLRVYVRNSKILILDEATSSIDSKTEQLLQNALRRISTNRTTIIIAHRLSTILHADKIIFLNDGKIVESGTHTELIAQKGMYYKMYSSQTT